MKSNISKGDIVEQAHHYDFDNDQPVLLDGPEEAYAGTRWRVIKIGETPSRLTPPQGYRVTGAFGDQNFVELELVEGEYKEKRMDISDIRHPGFKTILHRPPYKVQLVNCRNFEDFFPEKDPLQQFFEEWKAVPSK